MMSFVRFPLAFLLLLSTCSVYCTAVKVDLSKHIVTKRAYDDSDSNWAGYLSARTYYYDSDTDNSFHQSRKPRPPGKPPSSGPTCDIGLVTKLWFVRIQKKIKYGQMVGDEKVFPIPSEYNFGGFHLIIRVFSVKNLMESHLRASEIRRLIDTRQHVTWGREVIQDSEKVHEEMWFVVQKEMGEPANNFGEELDEADIPGLKAEARNRYLEKYQIYLPKEFENDDDRFVYWRGKKSRKWFAEIVGWYLPAIMPNLPEAEKLCIISGARWRP